MLGDYFSETHLRNTDIYIYTHIYCILYSVFIYTSRFVVSPFGRTDSPASWLWPFVSFVPKDGWRVQAIVETVEQ